MSSTAGRLPGGASAASAAAKAGVGMFTRQVANEVARHGVRVHCMAPGTVLTDRLARMPQQVRQQVAADHPPERLGMLEDVALATQFLVLDATSWLTGVTLDDAGGRLMR